MEDNQELQEGWQAHDLRSGVAKVYAEAKRRSTLGIRVTAVWAVFVLVYGIIDMTGGPTVAPPLWDFGAGLGAILLAALSMSRTPGPLLGAAATVVGDLAVVAYRFPEMMDHGTVGDHIATVVRIAIAPIAMYFVLNGYFGSLSIQAFKQGFSPGADWRTRINPRMMQALIIGSCAGALILGVATWFGAIASGFAQTNVTWLTKSLFHKPIEIKTARNVNVAGADTDGKKEGVFAEITVLNRAQNEANKNATALKYPESAKPITTTSGLDEYFRGQVEDAYEFATDTDEAGCLLEGQGRQDRCRDDRCKYWARVFSRACLTKSRKTEHFCDDVPDAMLVTAGIEWAQRMCAGRQFETCREILFSVQGHCHPPKPEDAKLEGVAGDSAKADKPKATADR